WKAEEFKNWTLRYSLIYLKPHLPTKFYKEYEKLVIAIVKCCKYTITVHEIDLVEKNIISFIKHYEKEYYQYDYHRLHFCRPVFHYILHVAKCLRYLGPQYVYAQWVVER
ncbi:hypothetical protein BJ508DRAFT_193833, partial [Ascobolus immersus RN42]